MAHSSDSTSCADACNRSDVGSHSARDYTPKGECGDSKLTVSRGSKKVRTTGRLKHDIDPDTAVVVSKPAKRRKITMTGEGKLSKRVQGRLSILPTLSYDILIEIFSHLTPSDLLRLSRVNKSLRLLARGAAFLWREVFANVDGPPLPEDMPLPAWAHLLYGPQLCSKCGVKACKRISYALRKRFCNNCLQAGKLLPSRCLHFLCVNKAEYLLPFLRGAIVNLSEVNDGKYPHYWADDVLALKNDIDKLPSAEERASSDALQIDHDDGADSRSTMTREEYLQQRREATAKWQAHAKLCLEWEYKRERERVQALQELKHARREELINRLLTLGHELQDITVLQHHTEFRQSKALTEIAWQRARPGLEAAAEAAKARRLDREAKERRKKRETLAWHVLAHFLRVSPPPLLSPYLPTKYDLARAFPPFAALLEPDVEPTPALAAQLQALGPTLKSCVGTWLIGRKLALVDAMPEAWRAKVTARENTHEFFGMTAQPIREIFGPMLGIDLAASVFHCDGNCLDARESCWAGAEGAAYPGLDILGHQHGHDGGVWGKPCPKPVWSAAGHRVVLGLLVVLGLEPLGTTALEMDRLDHHFVCVSCSEGPYKDRPKQWKSPRCWRASLQHALKHHKNVDVRWRVLSESEAETYPWKVVVEEKNAEDDVPSWGCNYCRDYLNFKVVKTFEQDALWDEEVVVEHCIEQHGVSQPLEGRDYYFHTRIRRSGHYLSVVDPSAAETPEDALSL